MKCNVPVHNWEFKLYKLMYMENLCYSIADIYFCGSKIQISSTKIVFIYINDIEFPQNYCYSHLHACIESYIILEKIVIRQWYIVYLFKFYLYCEH